MIEKKYFTYASDDHNFIQKFVIKSVERFTGKWKIWRLYNEYQMENRRENETFWEAALRKLDLTIKYDRKKLANIPKKGSLVVVANHPYGVLDGLIINMMMSKVRPDYKVLTNSVLCKAEETKDNLLEIDFSGTEEALKTNLETRKASREILKKGGALAIFPAGGVSTIPSWTAKVAQDTEWQTFIAGLVQTSEATVVPVFFEGQNSRLFQLVSLFSPTLRLALIFKEVADKIGWTIGVRVGEAIPYSELSHLKDRADLCHELRARTYKLGGMDTLPPAKAAFRIDSVAKQKG